MTASRVSRAGASRRNAEATGAGARRTHERIEQILEGLLAARHASPLAPAFAQAYREFLALFDRYQHELLEEEHRVPSCAPGCTMCCCHWVEDVNSFEAEIIADRVRRRHPDRVAAVVAACRRDMEVMERLDDSMDSPASPSLGSPAPAGPHDRTDRLLAAYYRLRRPCPLLTGGRRCMVYDVRPLTCRVYLSFSPPSRCDPGYVNDDDVPTCLVDLEESANALLDELHGRYDRFDNDTSLRSLLVTCLAPGAREGGAEEER
jgi:Fe-S-cluster containining protein